MSAVDELASRCGIQDVYQDVFGKPHNTSAETKVALLAAMGFAAADESEAAASLTGLEEREWTRCLPPVLVARGESGPIRIPVVVSAGLQELAWSIALENGGERTGSSATRDCRLLGQRTIDLARRTIAQEQLERRELVVADELPLGYHRFRLLQPDDSADMSLIVAPGKCFLPEIGEHVRLWGVAANLYLLRSAHNWGFGDYTNLKRLVQLSAENGADVVGLNPLHAMFLDSPEDASPYSPSDRTLLNVLNVDVEAIPELDECSKASELINSSQFQQRLAAARSADLVQYETVAELKLAVLRLLFVHFEDHAAATRREEFAAFHAERRNLLDRACTFQALRSFFAGQAPPRPNSQDWPPELRNADASGVAHFARTNARLVRFHLWLQWIADSQLRAAALAAQPMTVGLYRDLAVGAGASGAEVWSHPRELVLGAQIGAPPDILAPEGQNWGLPPLHPVHAREQAYKSWIELLRANMRYAGALRLDHAMALRRLYWIPRGNSAKDGAYVHYPMEDLLGILALESHRNRCLVVGEDLGSVPEGFREELAAANVLSYRVLFFEKDDERYQAPGQYPRLALAVASNHDLPTVEGWWQGSDIDLKERLDLYPEGAARAREERAEERKKLARALCEVGLCESEELTGDRYFEGVHRFLGRTDALLALVPLEDVLRQPAQVNLPGGSAGHPSWRLRLTQDLEEIFTGPSMRNLGTWMREERSVQVPEPAPEFESTER